MMRVAKRLFDIVVSSTVLMILSPFLLIIAILIKLDSKGPIFFVDQRPGKDGKPFGTIKFRTMVVGALHMGLGRMAAENDPRITRVGQFLRRWTLDEIP